MKLGAAQIRGSLYWLTLTSFLCLKLFKSYVTSFPWLKLCKLCFNSKSLFAPKSHKIYVAISINR